MTDDTTQRIPDRPSFEQQVLARLDAIDARLEVLEEQSERRASETKPIWERALAEIVEVKSEIVEVKANLRNIERKIDILSHDIIQVRAD